MPNTAIAPELKLFNTKTREKEILKPQKDHCVRMYTCGPTVYNYAHIGNYRTYIFEDLLRRTIKFFGMGIEQAMNLTDVDDKTIKGALEQGVSLDEFTAPFKKAFFADLKTLNIEPVEHYPAATEYITQMVEFIEDLLEKGYAYKGSDASVYFAIKKFSNYGCLSHLKLDELQSGASDRINTDEYDKENAADFVLWKALDTERDGNIFWESPFGPGRPGWHLECSTMAMSILGETLDIHAGGVDNIFPHHENEIAQSEAASNKTFSHLWVHSEHLIVDNKKMSKSLGNFFTLRDLLDKGYSGTEVRYMLLQTHYKTQLNFTLEGLEATRHSLDRLQSFIYRLQHHSQGNQADDDTIDKLLEKTLWGFRVALADDLNISVALAAIFDLIREINTLCDQGLVSREKAQDILKLFEEFDKVLGILSFEEKEEEIPAELREALKQRIQAREDKNWALADKLRDSIKDRGYIIEDTPAGAHLKKIH
ncbi:MAG: cysteinyl-tRNA synthetase [Chlamydiales bacterium]|jgi:cysteinyl-tRNA synthetase